MPQKSRTALPPLFPNSARAGLVFTDDGQIIYCSQSARGIHRKGLSPETVASVFTNAPVWSGFLPPDAWCWGKADGAEWIALCLPPQRQTLLLVDGDEIAHVTLPLPPIVFAGTRLEYYVWALGEEARTRDPHTPAFHAPFPNVNETGLVCFGTNILPPASPQTILDAWQLFLHSPFNDHQIANKSQQYSEDVRQLWRALSIEQPERFPYKDMIPMGSNMGWVLDRVLMHK